MHMDVARARACASKCAPSMPHQASHMPEMCLGLQAAWNRQQARAHSKKLTILLLSPTPKIFGPTKDQKLPGRCEASSAARVACRQRRYDQMLAIPLTGWVPWPLSLHVCTTAGIQPPLVVQSCHKNRGGWAQGTHQVSLLIDADMHFCARHIRS